MSGNLEYEAVVDLEEHFDPRHRGLELDCASKGALGDRTLIHPGDRLRQKEVHSIEINDAIPEAVLDAACEF